MPQPCMPQLRVAQVACGGMSSMVLTTSGDVWTWGEPWGDFTLDISRTPCKVRGAKGCMGARGWVGAKAVVQRLCKGWCEGGACTSNPPLHQGYTPTHMLTHLLMWCVCQVEGAVDIAAIAAGGFHNMALSRAGEVLTWGTNDYGQLGNGSTSYNMEPSKVGFQHSAQQQERCAAVRHGLPACPFQCWQRCLLDDVIWCDLKQRPRPRPVAAGGGPGGRAHQRHCCWRLAQRGADGGRVNHRVGPRGVWAAGHPRPHRLFQAAPFQGGSALSTCWATHPALVCSKALPMSVFRLASACNLPGAQGRSTKGRAEELWWTHFFQGNQGLADSSAWALTGHWGPAVGEDCITM